MEGEWNKWKTTETVTVLDAAVFLCVCVSNRIVMQQNVWVCLARYTFSSRARLFVYRFNFQRVEYSKSKFKTESSLL